MAAPCCSKMFGKQILSSLFKMRSAMNVCQQRRMSKLGMKKFYKNASLTHADGAFEINLDQRKLRTPQGNLFRVPNEAMAFAVVTEWNAQEDSIKKHTMPMTSLCNTAIDNPEQKSRNQIIEAIIHYLETDTVRFDEPEDLLKFQEANWDPVIRWMEERYSVDVPVTKDICGVNDLPRETVKSLERHLQSHNNWALFGYWQAVKTVKSLVLTLAVMDRHLSVKQCARLSWLEQEYQIQKWGNVEWYHDMDIQEIQMRLAAAVLFVHWSNEKFTVRNKHSLSFT